jgi:hypothetical protein
MQQEITVKKQQFFGRMPNLCPKLSTLKTNPEHGDFKTACSTIKKNNKN